MKLTYLCRILAISTFCIIPFINTYAQETETIMLSGSGYDNATTWDFVISDGMQKGKHSKIQVPSCWEQQGFGEYTYGRWYTNKDGKPSTEYGIYSTQVEVPKSWKGKHVEIVFEGVMTDAEILINGIKAGPIHRGAFTAFSYNISDKLKYGGKNRIDVTVHKESSDASINAAERKADWWLFGGIYRPVYLTCKPVDRIDVATIDAQADGTLNVLLSSKAEVGSRLKASIEGLGESEMDIHGDSCLLTYHFPHPKLWDPEHPNLYTLNLELISPKGKVSHKIAKKIGFRTVEFREQDGFYLNDTKLLIKGVNRHCFYPETGRTTSFSADLADVKLIKAMNANAIRSHYPPDAHLLDICDSLGVLYLNELAGWQDAYSTEQGSRILKEMVQHDASHPCIFVWSNGNEGGYNYDLDSLFSAYDPQKRHVVHAWALWNGVDAHHYPAFQTGVNRLKSGQQVFMPTEFLHSQYDKGAGASLSDFWNNWKESPLFAGGFIWAWADEGIMRSDKNGEIDTDGPNGPDGIVGPHREKEGSWFAIRDTWSPLQINPVKVNKNWNKRIIIRNDYLYSNLNECRLLCNGEEVVLPSALPGEAVSVTLPSNATDPDILELVALDSNNDTINIWTWPTISAKDYFQSQKSTLKSGDLSVEFDNNTGLLLKVIANGKEIPFNNGPIPTGFKMDFKEGYYANDGEDKLYVAKYTGGVDSIVWRITPDGLLGMEAVMLNSKNGHGYKGSFIEKDARAFGLSFSYPESECRGMSWLGNGPYRVWRNRQKGQNFGYWQKDYNNTVTGEPTAEEPILKYPEFKGYHSNIYFASLESDNFPFSFYSETDGLYFRIFTPKEPDHRRDGKNTMEDFPSGDVSFLIDIPPIQSYKPLEQLGPAAQVQTVRINRGDEGIKMKIWFKFD